jgi:phosphoribosylformylglycinamidine (FGAM) synthase PurS component
LANRVQAVKAAVQDDEAKTVLQALKVPSAQLVFKVANVTKMKLKVAAALAADKVAQASEVQLAHLAFPVQLVILVAQAPTVDQVMPVIQVKQVHQVHQVKQVQTDHQLYQENELVT